MPPAVRRPSFQGHVPTPAEQHEEWLRLLRPDGPFVGLPVLTEVLPQGLDTVPSDSRARIGQAWEEVQEDPSLLGHSWERLILGELLGWTPGLREGAALPESLRAGANTPDAVLMGPNGTASPDGPTARVLFFRTGWGESLTRAKGTVPSLVDRAADLARWREVPLALLTNGREWALVHARPKEPTTLAVFDADLWLEEPLLLRSFASLLHARRAALPPQDAQGRHTTSLAALFARTAEQQSDVTDTLGKQVREAVSLLVAELSRLDRESAGTLLAGVEGKQVYDSALTVMMRLVFLLYAEEQRLLPAEDRLYADSYAVGPLHAALQADRSLHGGEIGDRQAAAWPRLLAVFAAIHGGCRHAELWIPAYGGSLFDPARFPWLASAKVTDRVVYEILTALLTLRRKSTAREALSYKGLDVEQIGHVYEGLLEYSCERAYEPHLGMIGKYEVVLELTRLEEWAAAGVLERELIEATGATPLQIRRALAPSGTGVVTADLDAACDNDEDLASRVAPFARLLRDDLRGRPMVFPAKSVVMVRSGNRRNTGTHYTPKSLAEEIVEHTLAPLCFTPGPAEGAERGVWRAKKADELLKLRVLDPAMGSGAFLVSACRYLADRVVEAWLRDGLPHAIRRDVGEDDRDELLRIARRLVTDRCLYGVDRDPMAVELAKLSLWLVTLAKGRPFSFLDHALRSGDSLVGVIDVEQVKAFHLNSGARQLSPEVARALDVTESLLSQAADLRQEIEATPVNDIRVVHAKSEKLRKAEALAEKLRLAADAVVGAALAAEGISDEEAEDLTGEAKTGGKRGAAVFRDAKEDAKARAYRNRLESVAGLIVTALEEDTAEEGTTRENTGSETAGSKAAAQARAMVEGWLRGSRAAAVRPLHWPLEFPEVMGVGRSTGFDAIVGNPPFITGSDISGISGSDYQSYLSNRITEGLKGNVDICVYFLLRAAKLADHGRIGVVATKSVADGVGRKVGIGALLSRGWSAFRGDKLCPWPGGASVYISKVWLGKCTNDEQCILNGKKVPAISSSLNIQGEVDWEPKRLRENEGISFEGCKPVGDFFIAEELATRLIHHDARYAEVIRQEMGGVRLNSSWDFRPNRWIMHFRDWDLAKVEQYPECLEILKRQVKPERDKHSDRKLRDRWWRFERPRMELQEATEGRDRVMAIAVTSDTAMPVWQRADLAFTNTIDVFNLDDDADLCVMSSSPHYWWAIRFCSGLKGDFRYTPTSGFETFPRPQRTPQMRAAGRALHELRTSIMNEHRMGLTDLYNLFHTEEIDSPEMHSLRRVHLDVDSATLESYGWGDLDLRREFRVIEGRGKKYAITEEAEVRLHDRLLELNRTRYKEEQAAGLHTPKAKKKAAARRKPKTEAEQPPEEGFQDGLFYQPDALF
ncbi:Eco57I restriction-modification methylase domain-containing protein [Streptomyces lydicus]|uniref:Eco57I restriction-modification methylase domain-containing protein n=1 Tax=Streptomyces lydicus TaxID=47763 RepID=UPI0037A18A3F